MTPASAAPPAPQRARPRLRSPARWRAALLRAGGLPPRANPAAPPAPRRAARPRSPARWLANPLRASLPATLTLALATLAATPAQAQPTPPPPGCTGPASDLWLRVVVDGVRSNAGNIAITLYADDSSRFLAHHGALYVGFTPATAGTTDGCIFVPKPGIYAIAIYHDANANGKFDRTGIGFPAEAYGFSNNPGTLFGLPSFNSVRIEIAKSGLTTRIHLKYP